MDTTLPTDPLMLFSFINTKLRNRYTSLDALRVFLGRHASTMPRTMLRYAIEKLDETERKAWMSRKGLPLSSLDVEKWDETIRKFASL